MTEENNNIVEFKGAEPENKPRVEFAVQLLFNGGHVQTIVERVVKGGHTKRTESFARFNNNFETLEQALAAVPQILEDMTNTNDPDKYEGTL